MGLGTLARRERRAKQRGSTVHPRVERDDPEVTIDDGDRSRRLAAARQLSSGNEADVYEWGEGRVLRLLRRTIEDGAESRDRGAAGMRSAAAAGLAVPAVHELVTIDGRPGVVLERVRGRPTLSAMLKAPWKISRLARRFGEMHATLHERTAPADVTPIHDVVASWLDRLGPEDAWVREWALGELDMLPRADALLHGDFHPANVLMGIDGPWVIDWARASAGPAEADVARTLVLMRSRTRPNASLRSRLLIKLLRRRVFVPGYLAGYRSRRHLDMSAVDRWGMVTVIRKLVEGEVAERPVLRRMIRESEGPRDFQAGDEHVTR